MNQRLLIMFGVGVAVVAIAVAVIYFGNRGNHVELRGDILKIRTGAIDEHTSAAVVDFRIENPSDVPFIVKNIKIVGEAANGDQADGEWLSKSAAKQLLQFNRFLGQQYNESLSLRDRIAPHEKLDRMVAARFDISPGDLDKVKKFHLHIEEVDGAEFEAVKTQ